MGNLEYEWVPGIEFGYDDKTGEGGTYPVTPRRTGPKSPSLPLTFIETRSDGTHLYTDTLGLVWMLSVNLSSRMG